MNIATAVSLLENNYKNEYRTNGITCSNCGPGFSPDGPSKVEGSKYQFNDSEQAISYAEKLLELANKIQDTSNIIYGKAMVASSYYNLGALDKALKIQLEAHEIALATENEKLIDYIITHLALTYDEIGNYAKALEYYRYNIH